MTTTLVQAKILLESSKVKSLSWDEYKEKHKEALADTLGDADERKMVAYRMELDKVVPICGACREKYVVGGRTIFVFCTGELTQRVPKRFRRERRD